VCTCEISPELLNTALYLSDSRKLTGEAIQTFVDSGLSNEEMYVFVEWFALLNWRELY
jgi:hypothetical protein